MTDKQTYEELEKRVKELGKEVAKHKQAEAALKEIEERCGAILESIVEGFFDIDIDGRFTFFNDSMCSILGYSKDELMGMDYRSLTDKENAEKAYQAFNKVSATGKPAKGLHWEIIRKDKGKREIDVALYLKKDSKGQHVGFCGIARDVTERKMLKAQLHQTKREEMNDRLAERIAHEFSNILGIVIGCSELSLLDIDEGTSVHRHLTEVLKAGNRAKKLVGQIHAISRNREQNQKPVQVSLIIKEALKKLRVSLPTTIEIRQSIETDSDFIQADPIQIHQVLMNLCTNAHHAMREKGGVLEIGLIEVDIDSESVALYPDMDQGSYLRLSVSNTGQGIDPQLMERISDPYLSVKEQGNGTGLGLAVVNGIIRGCGGAITVHSESGKGTTFHVLFPRVESGVTAEREASDPMHS